MNATQTDTQLKQALARMLPEATQWHSGKDRFEWIRDYCADDCQPPVCDTELLHLCWLVEETLKPSRLTSETTKDWVDYVLLLGGTTEPTQSSNIHASWQQRTIALAKVKGVEIV